MCDFLKNLMSFMYNFIKYDICYVKVGLNFL